MFIVNIWMIFNNQAQSIQLRRHFMGDGFIGIAALWQPKKAWFLEFDPILDRVLDKFNYGSSGSAGAKHSGNAQIG